MSINAWWEPLWCKVTIIVASFLLVSGIMTYREWQVSQRQEEIRGQMSALQQQIVQQQRQILTQQQQILEAFEPFHDYHQAAKDVHHSLQASMAQCTAGVTALQEQMQSWSPHPR